MNKSFKTLWSKARGCTVVTSEYQKAQKTKGACVLSGAAVAALSLYKQ